MGKNYPFFVSKDENVVAELGSSYIQNYLSSGSLSAGFVAVSQRRAYFNGTSYYKDYQGKWKSQLQEKVVDLKDITGTGCSIYKHAGMLVVAIVLFVMGFFTFIGIGLESFSMAFGIVTTVFTVPGIVLIALYCCTKMTLFTIEFAGGSISFNISWYGKSAVDIFQKELRKAMADVKDRGMEQVQTVSPVPTASVSASGKAETLREYAKLREEGLISEEEFQQMKSDLISGKSE